MRQVPWVFSKGAAGLWSSCRVPKFPFSRDLKTVPSVLSRASKMSLTSQSRLFSTLKDQKKKGNVISFKTKQCCFVVRNIKRSRFILIYHREIKCDAENSRQGNFFDNLISAQCTVQKMSKLLRFSIKVSNSSQNIQNITCFPILRGRGMDKFQGGEFSPTQMWKSALRSYFWLIQSNKK